MAFLDFFKKKTTNQTVKFDSINDSFFKSFNNNYLTSETFLTCIRTNGNYASKIKCQSIREVDGERVHDYPDLDYLLQVRPNPLMNASTMYERLSFFYDLYNNAFLYIKRDEYNKPIELWSVDPSTVELATANNNELLCRFDIAGATIVDSYNNMIHIARDVNQSFVWGSGNSTINKVLSLIDLNYQGLEKAIKTSAIIRYFATVTTKMSSKALKEKAKEFTDNYLKVDLDSPLGVAFVDSMTEIKEVPERTQVLANFKQAEELDNKVYNFLQCPKAIVDGSATSEEKANYIESRLSPFMIKLKQEMTYKLLTRREYGFNNRIQVTYDSLEYASLDEKTKFFTATREHGIYTKGWVGKLFDIDIPSKVKDDIMISQNYIQSVNNKKEDNEDAEKSTE